MNTSTVASQLIGALREVGVKHVFGVPSGGWVDYLEVIRNTPGMDFVLTSHETGAGFMADVCARLTGVPGVCFGTLGPGATNLSTGVGCALLDRSPVIALTDEIAAPLRGRTTQMGIDQQALFRPITKATLRLQADRVRTTVFEAAALALTERPGPVHIGLPVGMSAESARVDESVFHGPIRPGLPERDSLVRLQESFARARKPLLVAGLGAVRAKLDAQLTTLAEKHQLPVVLTPMAKGLVAENHPAYAGVLFHALSDVVGETHQQADLIIAVGYDPVEFNYEAWTPPVPLIIIDSIAVEGERPLDEPGCDVVGDIGYALEHLVSLKVDGNDWDFDALAARRKSMFARLSPLAQGFGPCAVLDILRNVLPYEGIMTCDVGAHTHLIGQQWRTPKAGLQLMTNGWSSMGFGIPAAIAAKLCRRQIPVCAVIGDGGLLMSAGELATAARENLHIVFVLLNDNDLALIRIKQQRKTNPIYGTALDPRVTFAEPSLFGVPILSAASPDQFHTALEQAWSMGGPVIVEAIIDSHEYDSLVLRNDRGQSE